MSKQKDDEADDTKPKVEGEEAEPEDKRDEFEKEYDRLNELYEQDRAEEPENFTVLEIKSKIEQFRHDHPKEKNISDELINEAFRWRLSQNDCQNRGYVLDGYPYSYETARGVFYIKPKEPEKKPQQFDEEGNEIKEEEEEIDPEEYAKMYAPKWQTHIYPDSVIYIRGDDRYLKDRASRLDGSTHSKFTLEYMVNSLDIFNKYNNIRLFEAANNRPDLGHPKAQPQMYPMTRFFQEHKTEVFELETNENQFEMFEDMRVYVERNGRPFNYLPTVNKLN